MRKAGREAEVETVHEREERVKHERIGTVRTHPDVRAALEAIPGLEILDVRDSPDLEDSLGGDNVVPLRVANQRKG